MDSVRVSLTLILIGVLYNSSPSDAVTLKQLPATNLPTDGPRPDPREIDIKQGFGSGSIPCGSHSLSPGQVVTIQSENYPSNYPPSSKCEWIFAATSPDSRITITCNEFELRKWKESVMFVLGGLNVKWYQKTKVFSQTSTDHTMIVYFRTTSNAKGKKGFSCQVSASGTTSSTTSTSTSTSTSTTTSTTTTSSTSTSTSSTSTSTSSTSTSTSSTSTSTSSASCNCGRTNPITRIVGGVETTVHGYPWHVGLTSRNGNTPYCGGSIISDRWVITAAHCVEGSRASRVKVLVGEHNWNTAGETTVRDKLDLTQIIIHPGYNGGTLDNDIALLELSTPITFPSDNKIAPVCLPADPNEKYDLVNATATGWGTLTEGGSQSETLQEVTVETMTNSICNPLNSNGVTNNMICAGPIAGGKDACQGDSGGPLVTADSGTGSHKILIGLVSWGYGCARPNRPGVYTRVGNYLSWIDSLTSGTQTCPSTK